MYSISLTSGCQSVNFKTINLDAFQLLASCSKTDTRYVATIKCLNYDGHTHLFNFDICFL